jgi:hypothetical protein
VVQIDGVFEFSTACEVVFNTYIERELNTVEGWFEAVGEERDRKQLHDLLQQLMRARRRVTKYDTLASDQLQLCPAHWRYDITLRRYTSNANDF